MTNPRKAILKNMAEIEALTGRDERLIRKWVDTKAFPAKKIDGRWQAVTEDVVEWYRSQGMELDGHVVCAGKNRREG